MINYAQKIREYRERKVLTQTEFAALLGVSIASVTRWETGHYQPTMKVKKKIYNLLVEAGIEIE